MQGISLPVLLDNTTNNGISVLPRMTKSIRVHGHCSNPKERGTWALFYTSRCTAASTMVSRAVLQLIYMIAAVVKPVSRILAGNSSYGLVQGALQGVVGAGLGRAQGRLEFALGLFDRGKVGRIRRRKQEPAPAGFDRRGHAGHFVHRQIAEHDYVARHQRGAQHLLEVHGEAGRVQGPVRAHHRFQSVHRQDPDEREGCAHPHGYVLVHPLSAWRAVVAADKIQVPARLVHEFEARRVFVPGHGLNKGLAQDYDAWRGVSWRVRRCGGLFFTPQIVRGQHLPDYAQTHPLPALGEQWVAQFGQRDVGLLAHPSHELGLRHRDQAPGRHAVPRLGRQRYRSFAGATGAWPLTTSLPQTAPPLRIAIAPAAGRRPLFVPSNRPNTLSSSCIRNPGNCIH